MSATIDVTKVRQYNARLSSKKEQTAQLRAEVSMINNDINQLCEELSRELGIPVTPENAMEVYEKYTAQLMEQITTGEQILDRIDGKEATVNGDSSAVFGQQAAPTPAPTPMAQPQAQPMYAGQMPQATPQMGQPIPQAPQAPAGGYAGFGSMNGQAVQFTPPVFNVGNPQPQAQPVGNFNGVTGI